MLVLMRFLRPLFGSRTVCEFVCLLLPSFPYDIVYVFVRGSAHKFAYRTV